eukprot:g4498.t1
MPKQGKNRQRASKLAREGKLYSTGAANPLSRRAAREDMKAKSSRLDLVDAIKFGVAKHFKDHNTWCLQLRGGRFFFTVNDNGYLIHVQEGSNVKDGLLEYIERMFGSKAHKFGSPSRFAEYVCKFLKKGKTRTRALEQSRHVRSKDSLDKVVDRVQIVRCFKLSLIQGGDPGDWSLTIEGKVFFFTFTVEGWTVPNGKTAECSGGEDGAPLWDEAYGASLRKMFKGDAEWWFLSPCAFACHAYKFQTGKKPETTGGWKQTLHEKLIRRDGKNLANVLEELPERPRHAKKEAAAATIEVSPGTNFEDGDVIALTPTWLEDSTYVNAVPAVGHEPTHTNSLEPITRPSSPMPCQEIESQDDSGLDQIEVDGPNQGLDFTQDFDLENIDFF